MLCQQWVKVRVVNAGIINTNTGLGFIRQVVAHVKMYFCHSVNPLTIGAAYIRVFIFY